MDDDELRVALEKHHGESFGWALQCCGRDPIEAQDALQMAYLKILDGRARFDGRSSFKTWLLALIRHTAVDQWRRRGRERMAGCVDDSVIDLRPAGMQPDEMAELSDLQLVFQRALKDLPSRQQEVLRLMFYHDLSLSEAAAVMSIGLGSARVHYDRGKERLRQWLRKLDVLDEFAGRRK